MNILIVIGTLMIVSGIFIWIVGQKRSIPNIALWAIFPIAHGLHEFAEFVFDEINNSFWIERFELWVAFLSSIALLAAMIEYNGGIPSPSGKITGLFLLLLSTYLFFLLPSDILQTIYHTQIDFGLLYSETLRFIFGFIFIILAEIALILSYSFLLIQAKRNHLKIDAKQRRTTILTFIVLLIFGIFEGFDSTSNIFVAFRGISLSFFVLIPVYIIYSTKVGLQRILILENTGNLVFAYDFNLKSDLSDDQMLQESVLQAGFLAAVSGYSERMLKGGASFTLRSNGSFFSLIRTKNHLFALQSILTSRNLEQNFGILSSELEILIENQGTSIEIGNSEKSRPMIQKIETDFRRFL